MNIIVDENIRGVERFLEKIGTYRYLPGRAITKNIVKDAHILLVRSVTPIDKALLEHSSVAFVASATAGIDHIDGHYLKHKGIHFAWAPGCNATAVVEYVFTAMTQACAHRNESWHTKKVGIIGAGTIGKQLYHRLQQCGVCCYVYDPFVSMGSCDRSLENLLKKSDIITCHAALTYTHPHPSYHLLGKEQFEYMSPDAILINTARGEIIDNQALQSHLIKYPEFTVVLDVWEDEPHINVDLLKRVLIGTGHIAGYSVEGKLRGTQAICQALYQYLGLSMDQDITKQYPVHAISLHLKQHNKVEQYITDVLNHLYKIRDDAAYFRQQLLKGFPDKVSACFDTYRRHYLIRRECAFTKISVQNYQRPEHLKTFLSAMHQLGLQVD